MKYVVPTIEIEVLNVEDIVMVSNVQVDPEGSLTEIQWGNLT